jgi:archaemetzincin
MKRLLLWTAMFMVLARAATAPAAEKAKDMSLPDPFGKLIPLHQTLPPPGPGDWRAAHPEPGQTYQQYVKGQPRRADEKRRVIYVQPLGDFTRTQREIVELTAKYMEIYFGLPVKIQEDLPLRVVPGRAQRTHPAWGDKQILTSYVLQEVLYPQLPDDAVARIAFTTSDLWPGEGWNFVFGEASLTHRVGVWSIYRNGDPEESGDAFRLCLRRTLRTGTHETAHMLSMHHCTFYACNMCGSNHRAEADRYPLELCPVCLAKLVWATNVDPAERYRRLAEFFGEVGFREDQAFCLKSLETLGIRDRGSGIR